MDGDSCLVKHLIAFEGLKDDLTVEVCHLQVDFGLAVALLVLYLDHQLLDVFDLVRDFETLCEYLHSLFLIE